MRQLEHVERIGDGRRVDETYTSEMMSSRPEVCPLIKQLDSVDETSERKAGRLNWGGSRVGMMKVTEEKLTCSLLSLCCTCAKVFVFVYVSHFKKLHISKEIMKSDIRKAVVQ